jgi:predicted dithiol-disulfide oxidoreductase (DUF899 family)
MADDATSAAERELAAAEEELRRCREEVARLRRALPPRPVRDYTLAGAGGTPVTLGVLFGDRDDLIVVHNMGASCAYCTLWADGFNGVVPHLESRAAFVVVSPDDPSAQERFARGRGWRFRMASSRGTTFRADLGFEQGENLLPGVSVLHRDAGGTITEVGRDEFGPGDPYCAVYHLFDLLPGGAGDWEPRYTYAPAEPATRA